MNILLDTCTFLWITLDSPELSPEARDVFLNSDNEVYLSAVSAWEIAVKHSLGRLTLPEEPQWFVPIMRDQHGIQPLPLEESATLYIGKLPDFHRDPFDRMLICQAVDAGLIILTPDEQIAKYPIRTLW